MIYQARKMWEIALLSLFIHTIHKIPIVLPDRLLNSGQEWCIICPRYLSTYENLYEWNLPNTDTQKKSDQQRSFSQFKIALWYVFCVRLLSYARLKRDLKATRSHYDYCQGSYEKETLGQKHNESLENQTWNLQKSVCDDGGQNSGKAMRHQRSVCMCQRHSFTRGHGNLRLYDINIKLIKLPWTLKIHTKNYI